MFKLIKLLKTASLTLIVAIFVVSCSKDDIKITPPLNDNSLPSAAVYGVKVIQKSGKKLSFSIDLAIFKDSKNMEYNFGNDQFKIDTIPGSFGFKIQKTALSGGGTQSNYSALMLMDQSGSTNDTDPNDYRIDAGKIFCRNMGAGNNSWLWWFSDNYAAVGTSFTTDTAALVKNIESIRNLGKGGTALYQSQYAAIDATATKGDKATKALLTFTDGKDTNGGYTSAQIVTFANSKKVRLYNIGLGTSSDENLFTQAFASGGAFMYAKDAKQLISMFGNLGKLLDNTGRFYTVTFDATSLGTTDLQTDTIEFTLKVETPYNYTIEIPLKITY